MQTFLLITIGLFSFFCIFISGYPMLNAGISATMTESGLVEYSLFEKLLNYLPWTYIAGFLLVITLAWWVQRRNP